MNCKECQVYKDHKQYTGLILNKSNCIYALKAENCLIESRKEEDNDNTSRNK